MNTESTSEMQAKASVKSSEIHLRSLLEAFQWKIILDERMCCNTESGKPGSPFPFDLYTDQQNEADISKDILNS